MVYIVMKYHLFKKSRTYNGHPYHGQLWRQAFEPAETNSLTFARAMVQILTMKNPVGWDIYDSDTGEIVT